MNIRYTCGIITINSATVYLLPYGKRTLFHFPTRALQKSVQSKTSTSLRVRSLINDHLHPSYWTAGSKNVQGFARLFAWNRDSSTKLFEDFRPSSGETIRPEQVKFKLCVLLLKAFKRYLSG